MFWGDFCLVPWVHPLYRHMCARVYGMKPRRASVWVWVCAKKFGIVQVGKWRRPERQMHDSFPSQADLSFLALGLVCLLRLMILTFVLHKLACCKARICGLLGLWLSGRENIFYYIRSKENEFWWPSCPDNSFALYLLTDKVTSDLVIC